MNRITNFIMRSRNDLDNISNFESILVIHIKTFKTTLNHEPNFRNLGFNIAQISHQGT